jgi:hypothetical protein
LVIFYWWKTKLNSILAYKCTSSNLFANNFRHEEPPYGRTRKDEEPAYGRTRRDEEPPYHTGPQSGYSRNVGSSFTPEMDREPMYERKRPSTPPPGAVANPNVAKYPEYVEKHIDRCG